MAYQDFNSPTTPRKRDRMFKHLVYESGYVARYKATGEYFRSYACEAGPLRCKDWHDARVMNTEGMRHYKHCMGEHLDLIRVKD